MYTMRTYKPLNLQFFADPAPADDTPPVTPPAEGDAGKPGEQTATPKAFSQEEVDKIVQARLAKEAKKNADAVAAARTEAEKLATMTAEQRAAHDQQERESKLAQREADIARRELRATALQTLAEKKLPATLADTLDYTDADKCNASIISMEKVYRASVQQGVEERMKGNPPPAATGTPTSTAQPGLKGAIASFYEAEKKKG